MKMSKVPIGKLKAAAYNPRIDLKPGDAVYEHLKQSIKTFGAIPKVRLLADDPLESGSLLRIRT
jgi:ParB-like chromosome segregation protein Spo0J